MRHNVLFIAPKHLFVTYGAKYLLLSEQGVGDVLGLTLHGHIALQNHCFYYTQCGLEFGVEMVIAVLM